MTSHSKIFSGVKGYMRKLGFALAFSLSLDVEPVACPRPRVSKWGTYYPKTYTKFKRDVASILSTKHPETTSKDLALVVEMVSTKPKTGKLSSPRGDVDNYVKSVMDVITSSEKYWDDDKQVILVSAIKRYADKGESPGIHVTAYELD